MTRPLDPDRSALMLTRTKIVATVGPASNQPAMLRRLIEAGVGVFRLNFSHGTHEGHSQTLAAIRQVSAELGRSVGVLQDLGGPKIRLGTIPGDLVECGLGEEFTLVRQPSTLGDPDPHELTCSHSAILDDIRLGESLLFADGAVAMEVIGIEPDRAQLKVTLPGRLRSRQGLNLPGTDLRVPALTPKDLRDLDWTAAQHNQIDYVGLSFVRTASEVDWLRKELNARNCAAKIVAKIEKPQAVKNLQEIVETADAIMAARGDLGVEIDIALVPEIQKQILTICHQAGKPAITATQMLASMEHSNRPTRAEASDVFNAVLDGTDAVMLSGETAVGAYPVETVETMGRICREAETRLTNRRAVDKHLDFLLRTSEAPPIVQAIIEGAGVAAQRLGARLIAVVTESGQTALTLSKQRPDSPILALTTNAETARRMSLYWGVVPLMLPPNLKGLDADMEFAIAQAKQAGWLRSGQHVVLVRGVLPDQLSNHSLLARQAE